MHGQNGCCTAEFESKVTVAHGIHRVLCEPRFAFRIDKPQFQRHKLSINRECASRNRSTSQGTDVSALQTVPKSGVIPLDHFHVSQHMMREVDRLRPLQMRVSRQNDLSAPFCERYEGILQSTNLFAQT